MLLCNKCLEPVSLLHNRNALKMIKTTRLRLFREIITVYVRNVRNTQTMCGKMNVLNNAEVIHLLSHTNKCTNYIIYYLKSVLITVIKTLSHFHSSYMFRHITCHPQGALIFLAKITGKTICKK
jgi:hypothetical protein